MSSGNDNSRAITMGLAMVGGLIAAIFLGRFVAEGDYSRVTMVVGATFGILFVLLIGNRYWLLVPVAIGLDLPTFQLGGRNINFSELCIALCAGVFAVRFAMKREQLDLLRARNVPILLYFAWVLLVWALHPVGLAGFGSQIGGGRFYATILLAFAAFLLVANQQIGEKDIKWIFGLLLLGTFVNLSRTLLEYFVLGRGLGVAGMDLEVVGIYTWHQALAGPSLLIVTLLFSRYPPSQIFSFGHPARLGLYAACILPVLMSGKRAAVAQLLLFPLLGAVLHKQYRYVSLFAFAALLGLGGLLAGQGTLFNLPLTMQRALSWLPGAWDSDMDSVRGGQDDFRRALREIALEEIVRDPWMGDGFRVDINETAGVYNRSLMFGTSDIRDQVLPFALGKAWHNVWLGYAADFGIPLALIQVFVLFTGLFMAHKVFRLSGDTVWIRTMAAYCFMFFFRDLLLSWTSGHSANDALSRWWMYGMIFALADQLVKMKAERGLAQVQTLQAGTNGLEPALSKADPGALAPASPPRKAR